MKIIDRAYVESNREEILKAIGGGKIFIYPTDTIYGLGCNATMSNVVKKVREIKNRDTRPLSVIAPSKEWIQKYYVVDNNVVSKYLPGPYTLIVRAKDFSPISEVNLINDTLGVRIPKHWFTEIIQEAGVPFVTTSVNQSGEPHMQKLEDVGQEILDQVDYVIYEGRNLGVSSTKINLAE